MRALTQTSLHPAGNCWQTCVACIVDVDPEVMPPQAEYDWKKVGPDGKAEYGPSYFNALNRYLRRHHELTYIELHAPDEAFSLIRTATPDQLHMLTGRTARSDAQGGARHVVVARGGQMIWDPHPSRAGLLDEVRWAFLVPFPKAWKASWDREPWTCPCPQCRERAA